MLLELCGFPLKGVGVYFSRQFTGRSACFLLCFVLFVFRLVLNYVRANLDYSFLLLGIILEESSSISETWTF